MQSAFYKLFINSFSYSAVQGKVLTCNSCPALALRVVVAQTTALLIVADIIVHFGVLCGQVGVTITIHRSIDERTAIASSLPCT